MTEHFTAWVTNDTSALPGANVDITVLADEINGYLDGEDGAQIPQWTSAGTQHFYAETGVDARDGDPEDALRQAEQILRNAGWSLTGRWESVDTGSTVTVERS